MREILVLRHAEAAAPGPGQRDFDRPLTARGEASARDVGRAVRQLSLLPDLVLASAARRTRTTAELVIEESAFAGELLFERGIYDGGAMEVAARIAELDTALRRVLLVGHNPTVSQLVFRLTERAAHMQPASLALVQLELEDWAELSLETPGRLGAFRPPQ